MAGVFGNVLVLFIVDSIPGLVMMRSNAPVANMLGPLVVAGGGSSARAVLAKREVGNSWFGEYGRVKPIWVTVVDVVLSSVGRAPPIRYVFAVLVLTGSFALLRKRVVENIPCFLGLGGGNREQTIILCVFEIVA